MYATILLPYMAIPLVTLINTKLNSFFPLSKVLTEKIEELGECLKSHFHVDEFSPVSLPAQVMMCHRLFPSVS